MSLDNAPPEIAECGFVAFFLRRRLCRSVAVAGTALSAIALTLTGEIWSELMMDESQAELQEEGGHCK